MADPLALRAGILFAVGAALAASPAAADTSSPRSAQVHYGDLDLVDATGRARLDQRVRRAVSQVCPRPPLVELANMERHRQCRAVAMKGAQQQMERAFAQAQARQQVAQAGSEGTQTVVLVSSD